MEMSRELPKKYKKEFDHSYTLGPFPTFELLLHRPEQVRAVYYQEGFREKEKLLSLCAEKKVPCLCWKRRWSASLKRRSAMRRGNLRNIPGPCGRRFPMSALVEPADMGNLGTIERTLLGFGIRDLAIIGNSAADLWNPKAVRASMGALFQLEVQWFRIFRLI